MKYVFRWREKDGLKDLLKAGDYLNALIAHEEFKLQPVAGDKPIHRAREIIDDIKK